MNISRRSALGKMGAFAGSTAFLGLFKGIKKSDEMLKEKNLQGRINHSVCRWPYNSVSLEDLCQAANEIGITSIELVGPDEWHILKEYGLDCAMPWGAGMGIENGFNNPELHDELVDDYERVIPLVAEAGFKQIICFSGNRNGMDDETGWRNCEQGIKRVMKTAEEHDVILSMELLNSKVNHPDYHCDKTPWGVELVDRVGSDNFKLLYDIYHMQIMEGDVIRTIRDYHEYFSHYHTGGVPGRNEIDETQELYYPAIIEAIAETGFEGYVGQEFVPTWDDPLEALSQGVNICDV
ncbi:MAG: TIM barrel protein [Balneolaceae bacterium]